MLPDGVRVLSTLDDISPQSWDALLSPRSTPFMRHAWLSALEKSGCAAERSGWAPRHLALFRRGEDDPAAAGGDMNHLALRVAGGTYESLKGELEAHGVAVSGRPGDDHCIYFNDPDGHRLQLMFRK